MNAYDHFIQAEVKRYISLETNYRLFLISNMFEEYEKILYLDCDLLISKDISDLFDINIEGFPLGAVTAYMMRQNHYYKNPVFHQNHPYSVMNYCIKIIGLKGIEEYFNAGVLLMNLKDIRERTTIDDMLFDLATKHYIFNDQVSNQRLRLF